VWARFHDGQTLGALINGDKGWLLYMRRIADPGFSSRNPAYTGDTEAVIEYQLGNGQIDTYPASWAYPLDDVTGALRH